MQCLFLFLITWIILFFIECLLSLLKHFHLLLMELIVFFEVVRWELPIVNNYVLTTLIEHHANVFAKILVIFKYLVKSKQSVDFKLLFQKILLIEFDVWINIRLFFSNRYLWSTRNKFSLVYPKTWNTTEIH